MSASAEQEDPSAAAGSSSASMDVDTAEEVGVAKNTTVTEVAAAQQAASRAEEDETMGGFGVPTFDDVRPAVQAGGAAAAAASSSAANQGVPDFGPAEDGNLTRGMSGISLGNGVTTDNLRLTSDNPSARKVMRLLSPDSPVHTFNPANQPKGLNFTLSGSIFDALPPLPPAGSPGADGPARMASPQAPPFPSLSGDGPGRMASPSAPPFPCLSGQSSNSPKPTGGGAMPATSSSSGNPGDGEGRSSASQSPEGDFKTYAHGVGAPVNQPSGGNLSVNYMQGGRPFSYTQPPTAQWPAAPQFPGSSSAAVAGRIRSSETEESNSSSSDHPMGGAIARSRHPAAAAAHMTRAPLMPIMEGGSSSSAAAAAAAAAAGSDDAGPSRHDLRPRSARNRKRSRPGRLYEDEGEGEAEGGEEMGDDDPEDEDADEDEEDEMDEDEEDDEEDDDSGPSYSCGRGGGRGRRANGLGQVGPALVKEEFDSDDENERKMAGKYGLKYPKVTTPLAVMNDISNIDETLLKRVPDYYEGISFGLGEGGRELLRKYIKMTGYKGRALHSTSIPELLALARKVNIWNVAIRIHLEYKAFIPLSKCHFDMRQYKASLAERRREKNRTKAPLALVTNQAGRPTIAYQEGIQLPLGGEGRKQLLAKLRQRHDMDRETMDEKLAKYGLRYSAMRDATVAMLLKMAWAVGLWDEAVSLHLLNQSKKGESRKNAKTNYHRRSSG